MSKTTLAIIAGISAASGAAITASIFSSKADKQKTIPPPSVVDAPSTPGSNLTAPNNNLFAPPTNTYTPPTALVPPHVQPQKSLVPVNPNGLFEYGFPGPINDIHPTLSTTSVYDRRTRNPLWVAEHITAASLSASKADRKHSFFVEDPLVPEKFRAKLKDYARSGYDRGHQVPAADAKWSQDAMDQTFYLTNMCPQVGDGFNRDYWAHLEDFCRRLTNVYPSVRIVTGPLYLPKRDPSDGKWRVSYEMIGSPPNVAVPTHFYKIILAEGQRSSSTDIQSSGILSNSLSFKDNPNTVSTAAFVLPNAPIPNDKPLTDFEVPIEAVERASGLEFAAKLTSDRRKQLCKEVQCSLIIRDFGNRPKEIRGPSAERPAIQRS